MSETRVSLVLSLVVRCFWTARPHPPERTTEPLRGKESQSELPQKSMRDLKDLPLDFVRAPVRAVRSSDPALGLFLGSALNLPPADPLPVAVQTKNSATVAVAQRDAQYWCNAAYRALNVSAAAVSTGSAGKDGDGGDRHIRAYPFRAACSRWRQWFLQSPARACRAPSPFSVTPHMRPVH